MVGFSFFERGSLPLAPSLINTLRTSSLSLSLSHTLTHIHTHSTQTERHSKRPSQTFTPNVASYAMLFFGKIIVLFHASTDNGAQLAKLNFDKTGLLSQFFAWRHVLLPPFSAMFNSVPSTSCIVTIEIKRLTVRFVPVNMMECCECAAPVENSDKIRTSSNWVYGHFLLCLQHLARQLELSYFYRSITLNRCNSLRPKLHDPTILTKWNGKDERRPSH